MRHRRHQDVGRPPAGSPVVRNRRQAAVREGNRGRAYQPRHRPRRAQQQGHAGGAARRARSGRGARARRSQRRARVAASSRVQSPKSRACGGAHRNRQCPADRATTAAVSHRRVHERARESRYEAPQARLRGLRSSGACRGRIAPARFWRAYLGISVDRGMCARARARHHRHRDPRR